MNRYDIILEKRPIKEERKKPCEPLFSRFKRESKLYQESQIWLKNSLGHASQRPDPPLLTERAPRPGLFIY